MGYCYFAYRLPDSDQILYLKGQIIKTAVSELPGKTAILIHDFSGDNIYLIENPEPCQPDDFKLHLQNDGGEFIAEKKDYLQNFKQIHQHIQSGAVKKIVLSRINSVSCSKKPMEIFTELNRHYKNTFNYLISSEETGTWMGASPELLLQQTGNKISTVSLAGTRPAGTSQKWLDKEKEEQQFVTDFIESVFRKHHVDQIFVSDTYTKNAGPVEHVCTDIHALTNEPKIILNLLEDLHPTPATCGLPKQIARDIILATENHDRKFYTGFIGILNKNSSTFFVNLRCMELKKKSALIYVGGGITLQSLAEKEWDETCKKSLTLERVLN